MRTTLGDFAKGANSTHLPQPLCGLNQRMSKKLQINIRNTMVLPTECLSLSFSTMRAHDVVAAGISPSGALSGEHGETFR